MPRMTEEEEFKARKSYSARIWHITRKIRTGEPLGKKSLPLALELLSNEEDEVYKRIIIKLKSGLELDNYEVHLMEECILLNAKLGE